MFYEKCVEKCESPARACQDPKCDFSVAFKEPQRFDRKRIFAGQLIRP